ncbi:hypothetical protein ACRPK6_14120, partial [Exiguobacterium sp. TRN 1102]|uniref:hypothetical protein n=1 Tax=Exiguobacterium sp. TRN 1102 TaxID=3420732 RepID=UPI003D76E8E3
RIKLSKEFDIALKLTKLALHSKIVKHFLPHRSVFKVRLPLLATSLIYHVSIVFVNNFFTNCFSEIIFCRDNVYNYNLYLPLRQYKKQ